VVDNGDGGPEIEAAATREGVTVVRPGRNLGFAAGSNEGARHASGDAFVFLTRIPWSRRVVWQVSFGRWRIRPSG
jgi:GT2 family glycosyltransferase